MNTLSLNEIEITASRKIFDACDLNGDGFIDQQEFHELLKVLDGDVSREECLLDFEAADTAVARPDWPGWKPPARIPR